MTGTRVEIYGSLYDNGGMPTPSWQCYLDGVAFRNTSYDSTRNAFLLCNSSTVPDGNHEVNVTTVSSGPIFYFDYVYIDPSPTMSLENSVVRIMNGDPDLSFQGAGWNLVHNLWWSTDVGGAQMTISFHGEYNVDGP